MKVRRLSNILMAVLLLAATLVSPADAKKKAAKAQSKYFVLDASLGLSYDDNIIRYSDADLDLFNSDLLPAKFAIESKSDWIVTPQIRARLQRRLIGGQQASLTFGYDYFGYVKNDIRRYSRFSVSGQHYFTKRGYAQLTYGYIPKYYYRNLFYGGDTLEADLYLPAKFSKNSIQAEVGYDITKAIKGSIGYQYLNKSYNSEFEYRDLSLNGFSADGIWRANKFLKVWAGYDYENAKAQGADMIDTLPDYSYIAWNVTVGMRHYLKIWPKLKPEVYTSVLYRHIAYQSSKEPGLFNTVHAFQFGRSDNNYQLRLGTAWQIPYRMRIETDYTFSVKHASLPEIYPNLFWNITQTTSELERKLNYTANTLTLRISRQF